MRSWMMAVLALGAPAAAQQVDGQVTRVDQIASCFRTIEDQATGNCVGVSSVPTLGMLYPLSADFYFDQFGQLQVGVTLVVDGNVVGGVLAGRDVRADGGDITAFNGGRLGVGTIFPQTDLHIEAPGSAEILLEADENNTNEFAHPRVTFSQDGGIVTSFIGYRDGLNSLTLHANNDSDILFRLPFGGTADWEYHKRSSNLINVLGRLDDAGNWNIDGNYNSGGADVAEYYPVHGAVEPGDVVAFRGEGLELERAVAGSRARLAGIVSSDPGVVLGLSYTDEDETGENPEDLFADGRFLRTAAGHELDRAILHEIEVNRRAPLALTGRVPCKVSGENGPIRPGDLLTVASLPGHAMKATDAGAVIGTALEPWRQGEGTILVLANLGWFAPTADLERRVAEIEARLERLAGGR